MGGPGQKKNQLSSFGPSRLFFFVAQFIFPKKTQIIEISKFLDTEFLSRISARRSYQKFRGAWRFQSLIIFFVSPHPTPSPPSARHPIPVGHPFGAKFRPDKAGAGSILFKRQITLFFQDWSDLVNLYPYGWTAGRNV